MTHNDARILIAEIEKSGFDLLPQHQKLIKDVRQRIAGGTKIAFYESKDLQELYRRTSGGSQFEKQPFKSYRRPVSFGI